METTRGTNEKIIKAFKIFEDHLEWQAKDLEAKGIGVFAELPVILIKNSIGKTINDIIEGGLE